MDHTTCAYCGRGVSAPAARDGRTGHWDHVVPRWRCGPDIAENIVRACAVCNGSKKCLTPSEWARRPRPYFPAPSPFRTDVLRIEREILLAHFAIALPIREVHRKIVGVTEIPTGLIWELECGHRAVAEPERRGYMRLANRERVICLLCNYELDGVEEFLYGLPDGGVREALVAHGFRKMPAG